MVVLWLLLAFAAAKELHEAHKPHRAAAKPKPRPCQLAHAGDFEQLIAARRDEIKKPRVLIAAKELLQKDEYKKSINERQCVGKWASRTLLHVAAGAGAQIIIDNKTYGGKKMKKVSPGHLKLAGLLYAEGAKLDARDTDGWTPFGEAVIGGQVHFAQSSLFFLSWRPFGCRQVAAEVWVAGGCSEYLRLVDADLGEQSGRFGCGFQSISMDFNVNLWPGRLQTCQWLVSHGALTNRSDSYGLTPLLWAAQRGCKPNPERNIHDFSR